MSKTKRKLNKQLAMERQHWKYIKRHYPFLDQKTHWYTGKMLDKKERKNMPPLMTLESGDIPKGWVKCFGYALCEELREEFIRCGCLDTVNIEQVKEKFGELRIYFGGLPNGCRAEDIVDKYAALSRSVCIYCGSMDAYEINIGGWLSPICRECYNTRDFFESFDKVTEGKKKTETEEIKELKLHVAKQPHVNILPRRKRKGKK